MIELPALYRCDKCNATAPVVLVLSPSTLRIAGYASKPDGWAASPMELGMRCPKCMKPAPTLSVVKA